MTNETLRTGEFARLIVQHQRPLYAFILSLVPNWADADEILQATNLRICDQFEKYAAGTDFGAWARTIARYQVLTHRKQEGRRRQFTSAFIERITEAAPLLDAGSDRHEALSKCLEGLTEGHRKLVSAYYAPGAVPAEIAAGLGRSVESLRLTLFRIRRVLRDCIDRHLQASSRL